MTKSNLVESLRDHARGAASAATRQQETHIQPEIFVEWKAADEIEVLHERTDLLTAEIQRLRDDAELVGVVVERVQGEKSAWETLCKELEATVFKARGTLAVVKAARELAKSELVPLGADQDPLGLWGPLHQALNDLDSPLTEGLSALTMEMVQLPDKDTVPERTSIADAKPLDLEDKK